MSGAKVALNRGKMVLDFVLVRRGISDTAGIAELLIHPGNHANGPLGMQAKLLDQLRGLHGHHDAGRIVNGAGAQVPRIEMAGDDHDLFRMLAAFQVADHVERLDVSKLLRSQHQVHADRPLLW